MIKQFLLSLLALLLALSFFAVTILFFDNSTNTFLVPGVIILIVIAAALVVYKARKNGISIFTVHFLIYLAGFFAFYFYKKPSNVIGEQTWQITGAEKLKDSILCYRYPSDTTRREIITEGKDTLVNATYTYDHMGRRIMPEDSTVNKSILFFGCSYTYGDGVNDTETFPYLFSKENGTYNVYNYAVDGWGPQQTLLLLRNHNLNQEVKGDSVIGIFVFLDDHIRRVICSKKNFSWWTSEFPCFQLINDSLTYTGTIRQSFPVKAALFDFLYKTRVFDFFDVPVSLSSKDYELTAEVMNQTSKEFLTQFPNGKFYVMLFPQSGKEMLPYLQRRNLKILDASNLFELNDELMIPHHGHPNKKAYEKVADYLNREFN